MANDIIDINVTQTIETVEITVTPNLTTVNINQITGGGGGGGVTNLSTTQTDTNFTINSDTGNDAIVPLGNGTLAGATINDYTTAEKNKLVDTYTKGEVDTKITDSNYWTKTGNDIKNNNTGNVEILGTKTAISNLAQGAIVSNLLTSSANNDVLVGLDVKSIFNTGSFTGSSKLLFRISDDTTLRSVIFWHGGQKWWLNDGTSETGSIAYGTPTGRVGIIFLNNTSTGRSDIRHITTGGITIGTGTTGSIPSNQFYFYPTGNFAINQSTDAGYRLDVNGTTRLNGAVNLGEFGIQLGNLEFDNTPTNIPTTAGSMYYNDTDGTLDLILKGGNVKLQIGQESIVRVVNKTATNIDLLETNYQAVRVTGAQGQRMKVDLAQATTDGLSAETIGLVTETIANNQEGFVTTSGLVRNINTTGSLQSETWLDGDVLYLSPTVAGRITKVKPTAPNHLIVIGYVISAHATQGTIFVKVDNGYELDELHNVAINGELNEDFLQYESTTQLWKNKALTGTLIRSKLGVTTLSGSNTGDNATNTQYSGLATSKQDTLQSTVNIKSINGNTILGSGDLTISASPASQNAFTILANNTNATAIPTEQPFENLTNQVYSGTIVWTGGAAPSGTTSHTYSLSQVGNLVTLTINLAYGASGASTLTNVTMELPSTAPQPTAPSSVTTAGDVLSFISGNITTSKLQPTATAVSIIRLKSTSPNVFEISISRTALAYRYAYATIQYFV